MRPITPLTIPAPSPPTTRVPNGGRDDHADGKIGGTHSDLGVAGDADWSLDDYSKTITMEDFLKVIHQHTVSLARRPSLAPVQALPISFRTPPL